MTTRDGADVVIIGTGAAGATAARVLTEAGVDTVLIEEGPSVPTNELRGDLYSGMKRVWRDMGGQLAHGRSFIPILQASCVGGTTAINGAIIRRLPTEIYDLWRREHGFAFSYEELERVWDTLDRELGVAEPPDPVRGGNNRLLAEATRALGIGGNWIQRNVKGCEGKARCLQGCPTERKQSMNVSYIPRAIAAGARLYPTCRARRLQVKGGRAIGVEAEFVDRPGKSLFVEARRAVIVAASAIQTPLFLQENGIGRRSGQVGRRFQAHPGTAVIGRFDEKVDLWFGATQGYESDHYWNERMKFETLALPVELGAVRLPGVGPELMHQLADYGHLAQWAVQVRARAHGRVRSGLAGGATISYDPTDEDVQTLKLGVKRLTELLFAAGAREVLPGVHGLPDRIRSFDEIRPIDALPDDPRLFHCVATHLFGTAVMGTDPARSVVNPFGEAHELSGLFVADSSYFPTNLGVNPQHTIAAVAWLIAEQIANAPRR